MRNAKFGMRNSDLHRTTLPALRNPRVYFRFGFFTEALSVFIRVPKKFGVCRGALLRAREEFGVTGDKALF